MNSYNDFIPTNNTNKKASKGKSFLISSLDLKRPNAFKYMNKIEEKKNEEDKTISAKNEKDKDNNNKMNENDKNNKDSDKISGTNKKNDKSDKNGKLNATTYKKKIKKKMKKLKLLNHKY